MQLLLAILKKHGRAQNRYNLDLMHITAQGIRCFLCSARQTAHLKTAPTIPTKRDTEKSIRAPLEAAGTSTVEPLSG